MVRQKFDVDGYWKVIVYYNVDIDFLIPVFNELEGIGFTQREIRKVHRELKKRKTKAVTCSNGAEHISVVILKRHYWVDDFVNSLVHEAEHLKQAMLKTYMIEDAGEPPAYTIGYLVMRMWEVFGKMV